MSINDYLEQDLAPHLVARGLTGNQLRTVLDDVRTRLSSLLSYWTDEPVRQTLLLPGREEATFYEPTSADLDVRSLVVMAIRNSRLEDLASTPEAARQLGRADQVLRDRDIAAITGEAIRYFEAVDLQKLGRAVRSASIPGDPFAGISAAYPAAWRAVGELGRLAGAERTYSPVGAKVPNLALGPSLLAGWHVASRGSHVVSGMDGSIEPSLQRVLRLVKNGVVPALYADSFKMITRHPGKLFAVLEFVLGNNRAVVTQNYYLSNGFVARRIPLIRPAHTTEQARAKLRDNSGLCTRHAGALREMIVYC